MNFGVDAAGDHNNSMTQAENVLALHEEDDDDDIMDETLAERLWGLTEMFPEPLRNGTSKVASLSQISLSWLWEKGSIGLWVVASSATVLALPVMFEMERAQMEEQQLQHQRQMLLGPNAAVGGGGMPGIPPMPQAVPPMTK